MVDTYRKISELARVSQVADTDLFIVETGTGTKATTIETFRRQTVTKEDVGLGNVDNTSDATKNAAAVSLTNKTIAGGTFASPLNTVTLKNGYVLNLSSAGATLGEMKYTTDTNELYIGNGESNIKVGGKPEDMPISTATQTALNAKASLTEVQTLVGEKQDTLISGTNIKKINNNSILGSGNLVIDSLPAQAEQSGKFLTTDGTSASWATVDALPTQTGHSGEFLTTNGTTASWATIQQVIPMDEETISTNSDNELQAIGLINKNTESSDKVYDWVGTAEQLSADTWMTYNPGSIRDLNVTSVAKGNGHWVAVADGSVGYSLHSTDGVNWTEIGLPYQNAQLKSVVYGNSQFVAVDPNNNKIIYSTDGTSWTEGEVPVDPCNLITYGNGTYFATSATNVSRCFISTDLSTWTQVFSGASSSPSFITYAFGNFYAFTSTEIRVSSDGTNWSQATNLGGDVVGACVSGTKMLVVAIGSTSSNKYLYTTDSGSTWNQGTLSTSGINGVCDYASDKFRIIYQLANNSYKVAETTDLTTWTYKDVDVTITSGTKPCALTESTAGKPMLISNKKAFYMKVEDVPTAHPTWTCYSTAGKIVRGSVTLADSTVTAAVNETISTLGTTSKTIVGAINELNGLLDGVEEQLSQI